LLGFDEHPDTPAHLECRLVTALQRGYSLALLEKPAEHARRTFVERAA
jgi:hypothetical protein